MLCRLNPSAVAALPGVDIVVGNTQKGSLVEAIARHQQTEKIANSPEQNDLDDEPSHNHRFLPMLDQMHVFRFSLRQRTAAARMKGQIRDEVKKTRSERLLALNHEHNRLFHQQFLGETIEVLVEHPRHERWEDLTDNYLRVELHELPSTTSSWQHSLVKARLTHLVDDGVYGVYGV